MDPNESNQSERNPTQSNGTPITGHDRGTEDRHDQLIRDRDRADDRGRRTNQSEEAIPELDEEADIEGSAEYPRRAGTDNKAGG